MEIPDWVKIDIYNDVVKLQSRVRSQAQQGVIIIDGNNAYFQRNNDEIFEVKLRQEEVTKARKIAENIEKYKEDLFRLDFNPLDEIALPYEVSDSTFVKITKVLQVLEQRRTVKDRIKSLYYNYLLGQIMDANSHQYLYRLGLKDNQRRKLLFRSNRVYQLFKVIGYGQIYNTKYLSMNIIERISKEQFDELLKFSQELNA